MSLSNQSMWLTWDDIRRSAKGKRVYLYGRSEDWVHKAAPQLKDELVGIVDREQQYHGTLYKGIPVLPFENITTLKECYFVITAGDFDGIVENLLKHGLSPGVDFSCSPDFRDYQVLSNIKTRKVNVLFSSSDYNDLTRARGSRVGGGMFILELPTGDVKRVATGSFRQFERSGDFIYAVEYVEKSLVQFDLDFKVVKKVSLDKPNYCGLALNNEDGLIYLANAGTDEVSVFDMHSLAMVKKRYFNTNQLGAEHHVNDLCYFEGRLYCSYFSYCGAFKRGVFDGGVSAIEVDNENEMPVPLIGGLWKPHTPKFVDGKLVVLDSMRGRLVSGSPKPIAKFSGFIRGMCKHENYWFIGQSEDMYVTDRMAMTEEAVLLNSGVYIYDDIFKAAFFYATPGIMNIHCLSDFNR